MVVCALATAGAGPRIEATPARVAGDISRIDIENFGRVNEQSYRGGQPDADDYADLAGLGVKTLVNLTSDDAQPNEQALTELAGMRYVQIPMRTNEEPKAEAVAQFLKVVSDPASQPVYVHCVGGRHRTGVMSAVYRMTYDGWSADQAFKEMKKYKFGADFLHRELKSFVYAFRPDAPLAGKAIRADSH